MQNTPKYDAYMQKAPARGGLLKGARTGGGLGVQRYRAISSALRLGTQ